MSKRAPGEFRQAVQRKGSFLQTLRAVGWSFFGVRKSAEHEKDVSQLNPVHLVIAAVLAAVVFVLSLVGLVHWVLDSGLAKPA